MPRNQHPAARRAAFTCGVVLVFSALRPPPLEARSKTHKPPCKEINKAMSAGRTLEQIMADFQVTEQQVMKCTQKKGKRRKEKKTKATTSKHARSTAAHTLNGGKTGQAAAGAPQQ